MRRAKLHDWWRKNWLGAVLLLLIFMLSLWLRVSRDLNFSPWIDEFSTAIQGEFIWNAADRNYFAQTDAYYLELNNFIPHVLAGAALKLLPHQTWALRLPFFIFSLLVAPLTFLLFSQLWGKKVGFIAGLLVATSYFEITWSIFARGYAIQQVFSLLWFYFYVHCFKKPRQWQWWTALIIVGILGLLTHNLFAFIWLATIGHFLIWGIKPKTWQNLLKSSQKRWYLVWGMIVLFLILILAAVELGLGEVVQKLIAERFVDGWWHNNLWYYRAFLIRDYLPATVLFICGSIIGWFKFRQQTVLFLTYIGILVIFHCFFFGFRNTKYFLPFWPYYLGLVALGVVQISSWLQQKIKVPTWLMMVAMTAVLFIWPGQKFIVWPQKDYLPRRDLSDIPLFNYDQVYQIIRDKGQLDQSQTALVETWSDRARWYLGRRFEPIYTLGYDNSSADIVPSPYTVDESGEKKMPHYFNQSYVIEVDDLKKIMAKYPRGFLWLDDYRHNRDLIDFIEANLQPEIHLEDERTIWPGTLYSWGITNE